MTFSSYQKKGTYIKGQFILFEKSIEEIARISMKVNNKVSDKTGTRQGDSLSEILFNVITEEIVKLEKKQAVMILA